MNREVGISRTTIDGTEITSFLDPEPPAPDESLLGWVTRAADDHAGIRSVSRALRKAGFRNARPESLPMYGPRSAADFLFCSKLPPQRLKLVFTKRSRGTTRWIKLISLVRRSGEPIERRP